MGKVDESVTALISLLDFAPTDAEAWSELADLYLSQGLYSQATYALEEVLVLQPNAWNVRTSPPLYTWPPVPIITDSSRLDTCPPRGGAAHGR